MDTYEIARQVAAKFHFDQHELNNSIASMFYPASQAITNYARMQLEPSVLYRPSLSIDGNQWCALYGENLQDGVAGFGDSPELAMSAFNVAWHTAICKGEVK